MRATALRQRGKLLSSAESFSRNIIKVEKILQEGTTEWDYTYIYNKPSRKITKS